MNEDDRQLVAHMTATLLAGEQKMTIKQAVHNAAQILECVDARIHNAAAKKMFTPKSEADAKPFWSEEE